MPTCARCVASAPIAVVSPTTVGRRDGTMSTPPDLPAATLVVDRRPVAPLEVATDRRARARGLLGRDGIDGALLLRRTGSVHTVGMRFAIDVALCTADLEVVAVRTLPPGRLTLPRSGVRAVVEAEAGAFARWHLHPGSRLSVHPPDPRSS